jgi:predicted nuclease of restriction endonuclease-like (RecB) superfamily
VELCDYYELLWHGELKDIVLKHTETVKCDALFVSNRLVDANDVDKPSPTFNAPLPPPQSDLAEQTLKDPYNFDFLTIRSDAHERYLEQGLPDHIQKFLLELGVGFAFFGRQYHMEISGQDYYLDLLFYHLRLRCYVVIENESLRAGIRGQDEFLLLSG